MTLEEAAERAGVTDAFARRVWRALGLAEPEPGTRSCSELDVEALFVLEQLVAALGEDTSMQIARAMGSSLSRLADAEVSAIRAGMEAPMRAGGQGDLEVARVFVQAAEQMVPASAFLVDVIHRHHLAASGRRYALWGVRPTEESTTEAAVGFADVVGFTAMGQTLAPGEYDALIRRFEERALEVSTRPRARLVKLIGDEAMFVAGTTDDAIDIARRLVHDDELPALRVGLARGTVTTREGDLFGPVVNLAARLAALAEPGTILVDGSIAQGLDAGSVTPLGARVVQGLDEPVEVFAAR
jgi:class 3 adenylate cyclase